LPPGFALCYSSHSLIFSVRADLAILAFLPIIAGVMTIQIKEPPANKPWKPINFTPWWGPKKPMKKSSLPRRKM
jgi:hypothetical protein